MGGRLVIPSGQKGRDSGMKSNWLLVPNGVSQALMLAPLLFDVFVSELHDGNWFADNSKLGGVAGTLEGGECNSERPWQAGEMV